MTSIISIGLPFHNNQDTLRVAIQSIYAQSFSDWELILVDDGSTDESSSIALSIFDERIRIISDGKNLGLPARLNQIARLARGKYLARMDADDIMHPERLKQQFNILNADDNIDLVGSGMFSMNAAENPEGIRYPTKLQESTGAGDLLLKSPLIHVSVLGKTSWFRNNPYNESLRRSQDFELWIRTYDSTSLTNIMEPLMFVREMGAVEARKYSLNMQANRKIIRMHGPPLIGQFNTVKLVGYTYFKQAAYRLLEGCQALDIAIGRRNQPLSESRREDALKILRMVNSINLPSRKP